MNLGLHSYKGKNHPWSGPSLYDKNMIDKSEYSKGKYKLLGRKEEKARLAPVYD